MSEVRPDRTISYAELAQASGNGDAGGFRHWREKKPFALGSGW